MPKKEHALNTERKLAKRRTRPPAASKPKVLTLAEEEDLLRVAISEAGIRGTLYQPVSVLFPETMGEAVDGIESNQIHLFDSASVVTMLGYDAKSSFKNVLQALSTSAKLGFSGDTLIVRIRRGTQVQIYFFDTVPAPSVVKTLAHETFFYSLLEGDISVFLRDASPPANIIVREFARGALPTAKYLNERHYPLVKDSSAAASRASAVFEGPPSSLEQAVAWFALGKVTYFDAQQGAAFLNSWNLKPMSPSDLRTLTDKLVKLSSRAVNLFCPSSGLIHFECGTKEQTYVFISNLDSSTEANPKEEEYFYKFLQEDIATFLAKTISVPGTIVVREFAPVTRKLLPDFRCSFSPIPLAGLSRPVISFDSSATAVSNDGFGRSDSDSDDDLIFEPGTASHERATAFMKGALEPPALGPLQLSAYLKDPASEQDFKDQLGKLSEVLGICYLPPDGSSSTTLLFDDPPFAGDFNFVPRLTSEEELAAKRVEFSAKPFDESFFKLMFGAFLSEVACHLCKKPGRIRISLPSGQFEGAFNPYKNEVSIRFKALDSGVIGIPAALYNNLLPYIAEPYLSQLASAFYALRDFIIKTAGVACSIRISDTLFKFGTKKPANSMTSKQRLRIKKQIDSLLQPIKECLQNSTKEAIVSVWYDGAKSDIFSIKPGITSAGSSASEAVVAAVDLQLELDALQRDFATLQDQLVIERASMLVLLQEFQLKLSGAEDELAKRVLSSVTAKVDQIEKQAPVLRARIAAEGDTHTALAAKLVSLEAEVSALRARLVLAQQEGHTLQEARSKLEADVKSAQSNVARENKARQRLSLTFSEARAQVVERQQAAVEASAAYSALDAERSELLRVKTALAGECTAIEGNIAAAWSQTEALKASVQADLAAEHHLQLQLQQQSAQLSAARDALRVVRREERDLTVCSGRSVALIPNKHGEYVPAFPVQGSEPWEGFIFVDIGGHRLQCSATAWVINHDTGSVPPADPSL